MALYDVPLTQPEIESLRARVSAEKPIKSEFLDRLLHERATLLARIAHYDQILRANPPKPCPVCGDSTHMLCGFHPSELMQLAEPKRKRR